MDKCSQNLLLSHEMFCILLPKPSSKLVQSFFSLKYMVFYPGLKKGYVPKSHSYILGEESVGYQYSAVRNWSSKRHFNKPCIMQNLAVLDSKI